jgi:hypothetical protein
MLLIDNLQRDIEDEEKAIENYGHHIEKLAYGNRWSGYISGPLSLAEKLKEIQGEERHHLEELTKFRDEEKFFNLIKAMEDSQLLK